MEHRKSIINYKAVKWDEGSDEVEYRLFFILVTVKKITIFANNYRLLVQFIAIVIHPIYLALRNQSCCCVMYKYKSKNIKTISI